MKKIYYLINVDWYFKLHWLDRAIAAQDEGNEIVVACYFTSLSIKKELENLGFHCITLPLGRSSLNVFKEVKTIYYVYRSLQVIRPDVIHTITIKPNLYGGLCASILKIPSVKSITGLGAVFSSNRVLFKVLQPLIKLFYFSVGRFGRGAFVFENKSDLRLFEGLNVGDAQALIHIPGAGVDLNKYRLRSLPDANKIKILFAARLLREKGLDSLVSALELLRQRLTDGSVVELHVAGIFDFDAKDAYSKEEIHTLERQGQIVWLGNQTDMPKLLSSIDIVALPTRYGEGIPRILIEAGAVGRPVITSNVSGCNELINTGYNGVLVSPGDVEQLALELMRLIKDKQLRAYYALNLRKSIEDKYSNDMVITSFLTLYNGRL